FIKNTSNTIQTAVGISGISRRNVDSDIELFMWTERRVDSERKSLVLGGNDDTFLIKITCRCGGAEFITACTYGDTMVLDRCNAGQRVIPVGSLAILAGILVFRINRLAPEFSHFFSPSGKFPGIHHFGPAAVRDLL